MRSLQVRSGARLDKGKLIGALMAYSEMEDFLGSILAGT